LVIVSDSLLICWPLNRCDAPRHAARSVRGARVGTIGIADAESLNKFTQSCV